MVPSPRSLSPSVPGAWPASPSPTPHQSSSRGDPHYLRSRQHITDSHYRKITPQRITHSSLNSGPIHAISAADNTPTSFFSDDLSLQSSLANTSFSSAYTNTSPPKFSLSPKVPAKLEQQNEVEPLSQYQGESDRLQYLTPEWDAAKHCDLPELPETDQTYLSLPEIPDLSSLFSLREEFRTSRDHLNISCNELFSHIGPNEISFGSTRHKSLDTLSSSSIHFRRTEAPPFSSQELDAQALRFPQPDGRNSWTLFLSPTSASSEEPSLSLLQPARTSFGVIMSESECQTASSTCANVRRSWKLGSSLLGGTNILQQEETSTSRYANEVLDHAFNVDSGEPNFTLGIPGIDDGLNPNYSSLQATPVTGLQCRAKFLHTVKQMREIANRILFKPRAQGAMPVIPTKEALESMPYSRRCRYSVDAGDSENACSVMRTHQSASSNDDTRRQPALKLYGTQRDKDGTEPKFKPDNVRARRRLNAPSKPSVYFPCQDGFSSSRLLKRMSRASSNIQDIQTRPREATSENQVFNREALEPEKRKRNHRRSFLSCIGVSSA